MTWLPSILNAKNAAIAAAIATPLLLLLYFLKLRRKEHPFPSTLLWKKSVQDLQVNAPFQRLRKNLLLLLQAIVLLALLLAFARPVSSQPSGTAEQNILLIDRSASMAARDGEGGGTRLDEAKRRALDRVDSLKRGERAAVVACDASGEIVQQMTDDKRALRNAIENIGPTDRLTRFRQAYQLADAATGLNPEAMKEGGAAPASLFVYSDGRVADAGELSFRGNVTYERVGSDATGNLAIVALSARRNYERPEEVSIFARLANFGPDAASADVQLSVADIDPAKPAELSFQQRQIREAASLVPERWDDAKRRASGIAPRDSVEFKLELPRAAVIRVELKTQASDQLATDNVAQLVVPPPKSLGVVMVSDGTNFFLEQAIRSLGLRSVTTVAPSAYESKPPEGADVIVFDRYSPKSLPESGNFVYFGATPPGLPLGQTRVNNVGQLAQNVKVLDWQRDHPLLKGLNISKVEVAEALKLNVPPDAETIIEGTTAPLLVLYRTPRQTHLVCAFDLLQSDWPLRATFPYFLYNTMQFLSLGNDLGVSESYLPGATPRLPRTSVAKAEAKTSVTVLGPGTETRDVSIPDSGDVVLPALERVGLYRTRPSVPGFEQIAVNLLDANESNVEPVAVPPGNVGVAEAVTGGKRRQEWWWWLVACGALPVLMIEWWVYVRRVRV